MVCGEPGLTARQAILWGAGDRNCVDVGEAGLWRDSRIACWPCSLENIKRCWQCPARVRRPSSVHSGIEAGIF